MSSSHFPPRIISASGFRAGDWRVAFFGEANAPEPRAKPRHSDNASRHFGNASTGVRVILEIGRLRLVVLGGN